MRKTITVNGREVEWESGMTVASLLVKMNYIFRLLVIKVNGKLIRRGEYEAAEIRSGDNVEVIHMIAGG